MAAWATAFSGFPVQSGTGFVFCQCWHRQGISLPPLPAFDGSGLRKGCVGRPLIGHRANFFFPVASGDTVFAWTHARKTSLLFAYSVSLHRGRSSLAAPSNLFRAPQISGCAFSEPCAALSGDGSVVR